MVYPYTEHLLEFERRRPVWRQAIPMEWGAVNTPMVVREWESSLWDHPDRRFVEYLLRGMSQGFHIGFKHDAKECKRAEANMKSAEENPSVVDEYLSKEVGLGRVVVTSETPEAAHVQINRFGVIPKGHQPGKWRLIVDLSHPRGHSVNDGIEPELCSLNYMSVDRAVQRILRLGTGAKIAKFDVESAYRTVPVHPEDRWLLGMR